MCQDNKLYKNKKLYKLGKDIIEAKQLKCEQF